MSARKLAALANVGNNCFLNAVVQLLYRTPLFVEKMKLVCKSTRGPNVATTLSDLFSRMDAPDRRVLSSSGLRRILLDRFTQNQQHDAHEVLMALLEMLRDATADTQRDTVDEDTSHADKLAASRAHWARFLGREGDSFILPLMYGQSATTLNCSWCSHGENRFDTFSVITLNATESYSATEPPASLDSLLYRHTSGHVTDVAMGCDRCKSSRRKGIRTTFSCLPTHLIFHINSINENMQLCDSYFHLQQKLDMTPFISEFIPKDDTNMYSLYSVVEFSGSVEGGGHFTTLSISDGIWYRFDDINIYEMGELPKYSNCAYMLAYSRV